MPKYTRAPGAIKVTLAASDQTVTIAVEDNGIGISAADLPHVFGRFYRADPSRSQVEGTGLGLAIGMWIAKVHQATFTVESKENVGSVFTIVFRLLAESRAERPAAAGSLTIAG
jgi:signal transduction histidine kinase